MSFFCLRYCQCRISARHSYVLSIRLWVHPSVPRSLLTGYLKTQWTEIHQTAANSIQIVTGVEVIFEIVLPKVHKMLPWGRRPRATFYEPRAKNYQCWSMTPVTICFVKPQKGIKKFAQILFEQKSCYDFIVGRSMLPARATLRIC